MLDELEHQLERVRAYRADVAEPDAAAVAAARTRLMQAIAGEPRAAAGPAPVPTFASARRDTARARLRRLQRRRRFVLAGGLATVGVGIAGALGLSTAATPVSALAAQMNKLASVAASQNWTGIPGPGQYLYTESTGLDDDATGGADNKICSYSQVEHRQIWIATDGSGALSDVRNQSKFTSAADQATCATMGITDPSTQDSSSSSRFAAGGLAFPTSDWKSLSTDPATLLKQVHAADGGPDDAAEWFTNIADYMRESDVPPVIRAALYRAAALIPNVKLLGTQTDPTGQVGPAVGYPYANGQIHSELIFDQQTGRLLAEEYFDPSGALTEWSSYTDQKIVDSLPNYPLAQTGQPSAAGTTSG
ncbi:MAG TPA: CU044_5270 family protein [Solirubrobacteraceae bacterium]|jgi:RNA polymerase sigma-70 factor (ECF subfamily)|nr:CU044_5270 family protein [Solirubrobacteraceae bacterium]